MNIEQRIEQLTVAINRLNETMAKMAAPAVTYAPNPVPQEVVTPTPKAEAPKAETPKVEAPATTTTEAPTFAAISAAVQKQAAAGHKDKIKAILAGFKVAKVSELADEHRAEFLAKVEAL